RSAAQDARQLLPARELIHQLVEPADLLHQRVLDLLDAYAADHALDEAHVGVHTRRLGEEGLEVGTVGDDLLELLLGVAGEPGDDGVELLLRASLLLHLGDVQRVDAAEGHLEDLLLPVHAGLLRPVRVRAQPGQAESTPRAASGTRSPGALPPGGPRRDARAARARASRGSSPRSGTPRPSP